MSRYLVDMCAISGAECIWCTYADCVNREQEWRDSPWSNHGTSCKPGQEYVEDLSHACPREQPVKIF